MKRRKIFTLVELLAAVALMVLLAGIGFAGYSYAMNAAKESATKSLIARIGAGLEAVRNKHGFYPVTKKNASEYEFFAIQFIEDSGIVNKIIFTKLNNNFVPVSTNEIKWDASSSNTDATLRKTHKEFIKTFLDIVDAETLKKHIKNSNHLLEDAWGGIIYYCYPGKINTTKFDIIAPGPDGKFGKQSELQDTPHTSLGKYQESSEWACDDIANFQ